MPDDMPYYMSDAAASDNDPDVSFYREHGYLVKDLGFDLADVDEAAQASAEIGKAGFIRAQDLWRRHPSVKSVACQLAQ